MKRKAKGSKMQKSYIPKQTYLVTSLSSTNKTPNICNKLQVNTKRSMQGKHLVFQWEEKHYIKKHLAVGAVISNFK